MPTKITRLIYKPKFQFFFFMKNNHHEDQKTLVNTFSLKSNIYTRSQIIKDAW